MQWTILLVEDDEHKADRLAEFVRHEYPSARLEKCASYQSGIRAILRVRPDVVLLDMTLPTYDRERDEGGGDRSRLVALRLFGSWLLGMSQLDVS